MEKEKITRDQVEEYQHKFSRVREEIKNVIVGLDTVLDDVLTAILAEGHVLLEGLPGLGKTVLVRTVSQVFELDFSRIQFTPDLMPADIIGTNILMEEEGQRYFDFQKGPLFSQIILADEINRATPKTQSALLEAMQEYQITVAGQTRQLKKPFFVLATQNPIEMEGTYPLPEAQVDRFFFKINFNYPDFTELKKILNRTTLERLPEVKPKMSASEIAGLQELIRNLPVSSEVMDYVIRIIMATQPERKKSPEIIKQFVNYGASPRGAQTLILAGKARAWLKGRYNVSFKDINRVVFPALRHRLLLNFEGEASDKNIDDIIDILISEVPERE